LARLSRPKNAPGKHFLTGTDLSKSVPRKHISGGTKLGMTAGPAALESHWSKPIDQWKRGGLVVTNSGSDDPAFEPSLGRHIDFLLSSARQFTLLPQFTQLYSKWVPDCLQLGRPSTTGCTPTIK